MGPAIHFDVYRGRDLRSLERTRQEEGHEGRYPDPEGNEWCCGVWLLGSCARCSARLLLRQRDSTRARRLFRGRSRVASNNRHPNRPRRLTQRGVTLVEIMVVLVLVGLLGSAVVLGTGSIGSSRLRGAAATVVAYSRLAV